jgi:glutamine amidotransferase
MIAVLDYGIGNLRSAEKALDFVGADARLVTTPDEAQGATGVVLPGVGAFGACARALRASGLDAVAHQAVAEGVAFLGVCVGFQLMFDDSEESPGVAGLGLLSGTVRRLVGPERLPQMQWNLVEVPPGRPSVMLDGLSSAPWFYFVHSYAPDPIGSARDAVVGTCEYDGTVAVAVEQGDCWGVQFHPEKSGRAGLSLLERFVERASSSSRLLGRPAA